MTKQFPESCFLVSDWDMSSLVNQALLCNCINILAHRKELTTCFRCFKVLLVLGHKQSDSLSDLLPKVQPVEVHHFL